MGVSYNKLWKMLIDKNMKRIEMQYLTGISGNILARMGKNQYEECNNADNIEWMNNLRTDDNKEAFTQCMHLKAVSVRRKKVAVHGKLTKNTLGHGGLHGVKAENGI